MAHSQWHASIPSIKSNGVPCSVQLSVKKILWEVDKVAGERWSTEVKITRTPSQVADLSSLRIDPTKVHYYSRSDS
jgi:hypothetical protein